MSFGIEDSHGQPARPTHASVAWDLERVQNEAGPQVGRAPRGIAESPKDRWFGRSFIIFMTNKEGILVGGKICCRTPLHVTSKLYFNT